jgi:hypothetical protein
MGYSQGDYRANSNGYGSAGGASNANGYNGAGGGGNTGAQQEAGSRQQYRHLVPGSFGQSASHGYYKANSTAPNVQMNSNAEPQTGQPPSPQ